MTSILKKQLSFLCATSILGGALVWNSGVLRAQINDASQNFERRQKLTRDEAAKRFSTLMNDLAQRGDSPLSFGEKESTISFKSERELGNRGTLALYLAMAEEWKQSNQKVKVESEGDQTATVIVEDAPVFVGRPLVMLKEKGFWGVDLVATYAKWNNLEGTAAKAEAIYKLTGVVLEGLPLTDEIKRSHCQTNLKQIGLGILMYAQDYDEKLPLAKPWIDVLQPYLKSEQIFNCPSLPKGARYGYAYNSKLSSKNEAIIPNLAETVSVYETSVLKRNAYGMGENRAFRHEDGANYAFVDGHVKWFGKSAKPSFNIGKTFYREPILAPPGAPSVGPPIP
ncbi:MAG TPA: H-X9-DG-CTERM domain-containing protein [Abditibacterium sp.]